MSVFITYDERKRYALLEKLRARDFDLSPVRKNEDVLVFKAQYGVHIKALNIKKECNKLYQMLKNHIDRSFLGTVRTVIAHPVNSNEFLRSHTYSFVPGSTGPKLRGKLGG